MRLAAILVFMLITLTAAIAADGLPVVQPATSQNGPSATLAPLVRKVAPSIVNITVLTRAPEQPTITVDPSDGFPDALYTSTDRKVVAAGVIIDAQRGLIVTNNHVIEGADRFLSLWSMIVKLAQQ